MNISFHLASNRGNLRLFAPNAVEDMSFLVQNISDDASLVTENIIETWFSRRAEIVFACEDERMVGMAILLPFKDSFAFIENVSVFFPYQSQGIATKLINTLFVAARLFHNAKYVELRCDKKKIPANALYRSVGFFLYNTHEELNIYRHDLGLKTQIALQGRQIE